MKSLSDDEVDNWMATMSPVAIRKIVKEYHTLRLSLCPHIMGIPTGADDWIDRAIERAVQLSKAENTLRSLIGKVEVAAADARNNMVDFQCRNCRGSGQVSNASCACCRGTGTKSI